MAALRFLTGEEVEMLTGYKQKSRQARRLAGLGIPFVINAGGRPVVQADRLTFSQASAELCQQRLGRS